MPTLMDEFRARRQSHAFQVGRAEAVAWGRTLYHTHPDPLARAMIVSGVAFERSHELYRLCALMLVWGVAPGEDESLQRERDAALGFVYALHRWTSWLARRLDSAPRSAVSFPVALNPHLPVS